MPLESGFDDDQYADSNDYGKDYPEMPGLPPSFRFTEAGRDRFIQKQIQMCDQYGFRPTSRERQAIAHYYATFYSQEAMGATVGMAVGGAIGLLIAARAKKPWNLVRTIGNKFGINTRYQMISSKTATWFVCLQVGKAWGMTSYGVSAFNKMTEEQKKDPTMTRYLEMRKQWVDRVSKSGGTGVVILDPHSTTGGQKSNEPHDEQSLGGLDFYDEGSKPENSTANAPTQQNYQPQVPSTTRGDDDPLGYNDSDQTSENAQSGGSAWDRLRRGQSPNRPPINTNDPYTNTSEESAWSTNKQMVEMSKEQSKQDTFSFSGSESERKRAKEDAQRDFDERLERERQGHYEDSFAKENPRR